MHYYSATSGEAMTVSALNQFIAGLFEDTDLLRNITVRGEISNFKHHSSGHMYFSVKDESSLIRAVMFRSAAASLRCQLKDGMRVLISGSVSVYPRDGQYQLYARTIVPDGIGALYEAYEKLKNQLQAEGLFAQERKRPLPKYPRCVGLVTSATGAAVRDMIQVMSRRYPLAEIILCPAEVQGKEAPPALIKALHLLQQQNKAEIIIIGRGGGSIEDLWAFNDEALVRTVAASKIPIISAVGHETDFTLCDFAADLRAPTPSAAAELAVPDIRELSEALVAYKLRITRTIQERLLSLRKETDYYARRSCFVRPESVTSAAHLRLSQATERLKTAYNAKIAMQNARLMSLAAKAEAMSPLRVLARGYATISEENGTKIDSVHKMAQGDRVTITMSDGTAQAEIKEIYHE